MNDKYVEYIIRTAVELAYIQHEKGNNVQKAIENILQIAKGVNHVELSKKEKRF